MTETTVLVLGATGMLGNAVLRAFAEVDRYATWGSARSSAILDKIPAPFRNRVVVGVDAENPDSLMRLFAVVRPGVVVNCIGLVKQLADAEDPLQAIPINALLPHRLASLCRVSGSRLIHISTDCVFAGSRGMYLETDPADAQDLYGRSKYLGEVDAAHAVTLRTSIVGHELGTAHGLVGWFLSQTGPVKGFARAIFSGLPTVELARVIRDIVVPAHHLRGLYHVSSEPIAKLELLRLIAASYGRTNEIIPDDTLVIDRSLDSTRFRRITGYAPPPWPSLVHAMRQFG